jgi:membrane dipeptidase
VQLINKAEELGMFIDVSHLNDEGFWDVMEMARNPVIASHSNCRSLASTMRNLTDDQIKAIASKGGVIGINAANILVADNDKDATLDYLINHIDHIVELVGPKHVGLGFDFCDRLFSYMPEQSLSNIPRKPFDVIKGHKSISAFLDRLVQRGYRDEDLISILGGNFLRIFNTSLA